MLKLGGYLNLLIAIAHLIGLIWAEQLFEVTGIGKEMEEAAALNPLAPHLLTVFVSIVFTIFGLYGLSAAGKFRKLPLLKFGIFAIAAIYLIRGTGELIFGIPGQTAAPILETAYSLIALGIGLLFLFGGLKKWRSDMPELSPR